MRTPFSFLPRLAAVAVLFGSALFAGAQSATPAPAVRQHPRPLVTPVDAPEAVETMAPLDRAAVPTQAPAVAPLEREALPNDAPPLTPAPLPAPAPLLAPAGKPGRSRLVTPI